MKIKAIKRWIHLQHTRIAVAFAQGNFLLFLFQQANATAIYACVANESPQNNIIYMHVLHRSSRRFTGSAMRNRKFASLE